VQQQASVERAEPVTDFLVRIQNRERALNLLQQSANPAVQTLLKFRSVTNTVLLPSSDSSSGQVLDTGLALCGLLMEGKRFNVGLSNELSNLASDAVYRGKSQRFEQAIMDMISLGQRFNWGQLVTFLSQMNDAETLRLQTAFARKSDAQLPVLFAAVQLSADPAGVAKYLMNFSESGLNDLGDSLRYGSGAVTELLHRNQRLHVSRFVPLLAGLSFRTSEAAIAMKWSLYLIGGFLLAMAAHLMLPDVSEMERPLQVRGFHIFRETLFAFGFLVVVLLVSEPFLARETQKASFSLRLQLPTTGNLSPAGATGVNRPQFMNTEVLITMVLFFVLQALLYIASIVKLAEIRRQSVPARMKLRLLENEEHLFDAGLYLGFLGTIVSLVLVSMGVFKQPSLMAAYSSTSFGILFVVVFKILHLRPAKRTLLLEAEAARAMESVESTRPLSAPL
jgi:hypothetical protein